jgi:hypothetical protein
LAVKLAGAGRTEHHPVAVEAILVGHGLAGRELVGVDSE